MKKTLLLLSVSVMLGANAQVYNAKHVNKLKSQNQLTGKERFFNPLGGTTHFKISNPGQTQATSSVCGCWIDRDSTFSIVPFDGSGGSGGPGLPPNYENDDWSTNAVALPFHLCLYGSTYDSLFINNNGNISFGAPYSTFTANSFPDPSYIMIAPFWSDVDTRGMGSGYVYYKLTPTVLIIQWDSVGYYYEHIDKRNTFQLIITNGTDSIIPGGNNISFCYKDMNWTTGDASSGNLGFGGTPATVGVNKGDGVHYFQVGLFDHDSTGYDGSFGSTDGVKWLNNRSISANVCDTFNIPPMAIDSTCDTTVVYLAQTITSNLRFLSPEGGQITTVTATGPSGFNVTNTNNANFASVQYQFTGSVSNVGYNTVTITAQDNGSGNQSTIVKKVIQVLGSTGIQTSALNTVELFPNPSFSKIHVKLNSNEKGVIRLTSLLGETVLEQELIAGSNELNIEHLKNGTYIAEVKTRDLTLIKKVIKIGE